MVFVNELYFPKKAKNARLTTRLTRKFWHHLLINDPPHLARWFVQKWVKELEPRCKWVTNTGRFIKLSVITNIYKKKTKGHILMEFFTATGKRKSFFLTTRDVRCVDHGSHGTHRYDIQVVATRASTCWSYCHTRVNMLMRVWQQLEYHIDVCRATRGAHIEHL